MNKIYLFTRKHDKESYKFFLNRSISWVDNKPYYYISVDTPGNCFGYEDHILLDSDGIASTMYRYLPPYILERIGLQMRRAAKKYCNDKAYTELM